MHSCACQRTADIAHVWCRHEKAKSLVVFTPAKLDVEYGPFLLVVGQRGKASYFDTMNEKTEQGQDEDWNKYSAPHTTGKKVIL